MKQTCFLILGMHRSGTSALTGVLSLLDIYLGSDLMSASNDNEKGYFENNNLYQINEKLLAQIGSSWEDIFFVEDKLKDLVDISELKEQIINDFQYCKTFAIKDPRLAFLFPVYKKALKELGIKIKVIIPYRNPIEVASSLKKRDHFIFENAMLLWAYHILLAEKFSRQYKRVFIAFDELISEPDRTINLISEKLGVRLTEKYTKKQSEIKRFLEPDLKHYNISIDNLSDNTPKIIHKILSFRSSYNKKSIFKSFDHLRIEFFDYQKLFYNPSIVQTFLNFKKIEQDFATKNQLLSQRNLALESTKDSLSINLKTVAQQKETLKLTSKELDKKSNLLVKSELNLNEASIKLTQTTESFQQQKEILNNTQHELNKKNILLAENEQRLNIIQNNFVQSEREIEQLLQELMKSKQSKKQIEQTLLKTQNLLDEKDILLKNSLLSLENAQVELDQWSELIINHQKELTQSKQEYQKIKKILTQSEQALIKSEEELSHKDKIIIENESSLRDANIEFNNIKTQIDHLEDELVSIYTSPTYKFARLIRNIVGNFK